MLSNYPVSYRVFERYHRTTRFDGACGSFIAERIEIGLSVDAVRASERYLSCLVIEGGDFPHLPPSLALFSRYLLQHPSKPSHYPATAHFNDDTHSVYAVPGVFESYLIMPIPTLPNGQTASTLADFWATFDLQALSDVTSTSNTVATHCA